MIQLSDVLISLCKSMFGVSVGDAAAPLGSRDSITDSLFTAGYRDIQVCIPYTFLLKLAAVILFLSRASGCMGCTPVSALSLTLIHLTGNDERCCIAGPGD